MSYLKYTAYLYLIAAAFFTFDGITRLQNNESAFMSLFLAAMSVFMFFFRRRYQKKFQERREERKNNN